MLKTVKNKHKERVKKIEAINMAKELLKADVRKEVEMDIVHFLINKNDTALFSEFFEDLENPYLKGITNNSKMEYIKA